MNAVVNRGRPGVDDAARVGFLTSFFERLGPLEGLVRIILKDAPISARLELRGSPTGEVRLDYSFRPAVIQAGVRARPGIRWSDQGDRVVPSRSPSFPPGRIQVSIDSGVMHQVLLGKMTPGEALGRRELLLRGSAADLARFIPLLDFAPLLYREHLADLGHDDFGRKGPRAKDPRAKGPRAKGPRAKDPRAKGQSGEDSSMKDSSTKDSSTKDRSTKDSSMKTGGFRGDPISLRSLTGPERAIFRVINDAAFAAGYGVGLLRHRFLRNLSLFEVLRSLSRGVEAAASASSREPTGSEAGHI